MGLYVPQRIATVVHTIYVYTWRCGMHYFPLQWCFGIVACLCSLDAVAKMCGACLRQAGLWMFKPVPVFKREWRQV
jgi:hypothetical protein